MSDLRKAAEMALELLENHVEDPRCEISICKTIAALRQALAQPEQEPVAWVYNGILHEFDPSEFATSKVTPLYTAPPKREWVGLTDIERMNCYEHNIGKFAINIEAKLKEKNT